MLNVTNQTGSSSVRILVQTYRPLLPIWQTVLASYTVSLRRAPEILDLSLGPILISVIGFAAIIGWGMPNQWVEHVSADAAMPAFIAFLLLSAILGIPSITAWHRRVLGSSIGNQNVTGFSIGLPEFAYLWHAMFLGFIWLGMCLIAVLATGCVVAVAVISYDGNPLTPQSIEAIALGGLGAIAVGPVSLTSRLALILPACAASHDFSYDESWRYTAGNTWRFMLAVVLSVVPLMIAAVGIWNAVGSPSIRIIMMIPIWHLSLFLVATTISLVYCHLVEGEDIVLPGERTT